MIPRRLNENELPGNNLWNQLIEHVRAITPFTGPRVRVLTTSTGTTFDVVSGGSSDGGLLLSGEFEQPPQNAWRNPINNFPFSGRIQWVTVKADTIPEGIELKFRVRINESDYWVAFQTDENPPTVYNDGVPIPVSPGTRFTYYIAPVAQGDNHHGYLSPGDNLQVAFEWTGNYQPEVCSFTLLIQ